MFCYELKPNLAEDLFDFTESDRRFINLSKRYNKRMVMRRHIYTHFTCMLQDDDCKIAIQELFCDIMNIITLRLMQAVGIF